MAGGLGEIRDYAHDLKNMAAYVGAQALADLAAAIETAAREGADAEARAMIAELPATRSATVHSLNEAMATA